MVIRSLYIGLIAVGAVLVMMASASGQNHEYDTVQIKTVKVAHGIYMLEGAGGNLGVSSGPDGVLLIDDQLAPLTDKIRAAVAKINERPIRFVFNTHWHFDHVGGNENFGRLGSVIVAHDNVRKRLSTDQMVEFIQKEIPATAKEGLPVITFTRDITFHLNGDTIEIFHLPNAHTDGDAAVYFRKANVLHTGDIYFAGTYPFIDTGSNGSVTGVIQAANRILSMIDDDTKVIPGHGPLSNKAELKAYVAMLSTLKKAVAGAIADGKTIEQIQEEKLSKAFDSEWGDGSLPPDKFIQILYADLSRGR